MKGKMRLFGHMMRKEDSLEKLIIEGNINGKRKQGWPQTSWLIDKEKWNGQRRNALRNSHIAK